MTAEKPGVTVAPRLDRWPTFLENCSCTAEIVCPKLCVRNCRVGRSWIPTFSHVVHLNLDFYTTMIPLAPSHGFSPHSNPLI